MATMNRRNAPLLAALVLICAAAVVRLGGAIYSFHEFQLQGTHPSAQGGRTVRHARITHPKKRGVGHPARTVSNAPRSSK